MNKLPIASLALFAALLLAVPARAQTALGLNVQYGLDFDEFQGGVELHVPFNPVSGLSFVPNFEYYFQDEPTVFAINGDAHYAFGNYTRSFTPYVGLGLALVRQSEEDRDSETDAGLNIIGGANFRTGGNTLPFFQVEYRAMEDDELEDLSLGAGIRLMLR